MTPPSGTYEIFISYSRKDNVPRRSTDPKGWVSLLCDEIVEDQRRFTTDPLRVFFDTSEIADMDDWRHKILQGLRGSRILLVCLSPNYLKSEYCQWEFEEYRRHQIHARMGHDSIAPVYFAEVPPASQGTIEGTEASWTGELLRGNFTDLRPWFPLGAMALRDAEVRRRMGILGTKLWERIERARRSSGVPSNLRQLNRHFVGRHGALRTLHESVALGPVGNVTVVHGLGGVGKTELVTAYAHGWAHLHATGLWNLAAEGRSELLPLLGDLHLDLGIPTSVSPEETAVQRGRRVLLELRNRSMSRRNLDENVAESSASGGACLVILDNVSDPHLLSGPEVANLPAEDWLRVVVTTREAPEKFGGWMRRDLTFVAVDALNSDEATSLLASHQRDGRWPISTAAEDERAAEEIVAELDGFTLAVESVAVHLGMHPEIRPVAYLSKLRAEGLRAVSDLPSNPDVAAQMLHRDKLLEIVIKQMLIGLEAPACTALGCAALLPPDHIPNLWLRAIVEAEHPNFLQGTSENNWSVVLRRLAGMRLLVPGEHPEISRLHRLVGECVRTLFSESASRREEMLLEHASESAALLSREGEWGKADRAWLLRCIASFGESLISSDHPGGLKLIADCARPLLEHWEVAVAERVVALALSWSDQYPEYDHLKAPLLNCMGDILRERRQFDKARERIDEAYQLALAVDQPSFLNLSRIFNNRGLLELRLGNFEEAERAFLKALEHLDVAEPNQPTVEAESAIIRNNLADLMMAMRRPEEAAAMMKQVVDELSSRLGEIHPDVATALHNLGVFEESLGHFAEAAACHERSAIIYEKAFGGEHLRTGTTLGDLARVLSLKGDHTRAVEAMTKAISILRRIPETERFGSRRLDLLADELLWMLMRDGRSRFEATVLLSGIHPEKVPDKRMWWAIWVRHKLVPAEALGNVVLGFSSRFWRKVQRIN